MKKSCFLLIGITVLIIGWMWVSSPYFNAMEPVSVSVVIPDKKDIYDSVISKGSIEEGNSKEIRVAASAKVENIHVEIGDKVEKGQLLFEVSPSEHSSLNVASVIPEISGIDYDAVKSFIEEYDIDPSVYLNSVGAFNVSDAEIDREITSPISGIITELNAKEDDIISGYQAAAVVSDLSNLYVRVQIPELYIDRIKVGQEAEITGDAFSKTYRGKVEKIYPKATKKTSLTGTGETVVDTLVSITSPDSLLKPGYSVSAKIYTQKKSKAITLPYNCIWQDEKNRELVFVIKDGIAYKRRVATGLELDDEVEITYGLDGWETVITSPPQQLKNGNAVREVRG